MSFTSKTAPSKRQVVDISDDSDSGPGGATIKPKDCAPAKQRKKAKKVEFVDLTHDSSLESIDVAASDKSSGQPPKSKDVGVGPAPNATVSGLDPDSDSEEEDATCPICMDLFLEPAFLSPCGHCFCRSCVDAWLEEHKDQGCPTCRGPTKQGPTPALLMESTVRRYFNRRVRLLEMKGDGEGARAMREERAERVKAAESDKVARKKAESDRKAAAAATRQAALRAAHDPRMRDNRVQAQNYAAIYAASLAGHAFYPPVYSQPPAAGPVASTSHQPAGAPVFNAAAYYNLPAYAGTGVVFAPRAGPAVPPQPVGRAARQPTFNDAEFPPLARF